MTDAETVAHLRRWAANPPPSGFAWPTDACGYEQHMRFVQHRNTHWSTNTERKSADFPAFVLQYADMLEAGLIPPYTRR